MVMSKKEYEQMEYYKNMAIKYEHDYNRVLSQIKDIKSFLRVAKTYAEINEYDEKAIIYDEMLQCVNKYVEY